jgi:NAD(P)-dependent dehydrogenase (short-subunit alcohol dehydrogenase family)
MNGKKIALVTGAAQGIGLACAEALAEDGLFVVLSDVKAEEVKAAAERLGANADHVVCDIGDPEAIAAMFRTVEERHGAVSVLVNNAGIAMPGPFLETPEENFRKVIDVNLVGVFLTTQRAAKAMIENDISGSIINMSSINAVVAIPAIPAYCASKGGVMQLTKAASLALAPHNIRVNAVGPGSIDTEMMAGVNANPEAMKMAMSRTPLKRMGSPREIGDVVAFLASDKASYVTGETIYVDGGRLGLNYVC